MRHSAVLLVTAALLFAGCSPRDSDPTCVAALDLETLVHDALPENFPIGGTSSSGTWIPKNPSPALAEQLEEIPTYPSHVAMEFHFPQGIFEFEDFHYTLCDSIEQELTTSCGSVERNDRYLACTFKTRSRGRIGYVEILPDTPELAERTLIVVADEW